MPTTDSNGAMNPFATPFFPFASPQHSFATRCARKSQSSVQAQRCEREDSLSFRDQTPRFTTPASGQSVGHDTSSQLSIETPENYFHGPESGRTKDRGGFAAGGKTIENSGPNIGSKWVSELPGTNVPQTHRMTGEKVASDTNNSAVPDNDPQLTPMEGVPAPESMPPGLYPYFTYPVVSQLPHGGGCSIYPRPPVLPILPSSPPPPGPCFPLLHMVPCQIMDVSTGRPLPDRYTFAFRVTYWSPPIFAMPSPNFQAQEQNPQPLQEEMNTRTHGHLAHEPLRLTSMAQAVDVLNRIDEVHIRSSSLEEIRAVEDRQNGTEKSIDDGVDIESDPPAVYQGSSEGTELPSAVDGPQDGEGNDRVKQQLKQDRHVLFISQQHHSAIKESTVLDASPSTMQPKPSAKHSRKGQASDRPSQNQTLAEVASWSQSKRWLSSETKERRAFQKMMLNLQFMKADQSPFIPKTPAELTKFKISLAEAKQQKLALEVSILEEKTRQKELAKALGLVPVYKPQVTLFNGRDMVDRLSPVFAVRNCFNKQDIAEVNSCVAWPSLAELKEEGDRRTRCGRYLPLPRINIEKKAVKTGSWNIPPITSSLDSDSDDAPQLELADLNGFLREFVLAIQKHES
ncbi:hypothetical protein V8C42DRAFT_340183 [Trichoderma barbatum]